MEPDAAELLDEDQESGDEGDCMQDEENAVDEEDEEEEEEEDGFCEGEEEEQEEDDSEYEDDEEAMAEAMGQSSAEAAEQAMDDIPVHQMHMVDRSQLGLNSASSGSAGPSASASAAATRETSFAFRQRQDAACGGIGKRRLTRRTTVGPVLRRPAAAVMQRPAAAAAVAPAAAPRQGAAPKTACRGKRRQTGGEAPSEAAEDDGVPLPDEPQEGEVGIPDYEDIPYTRAQQVSPGRERGRKKTRARTRRTSRGESLWWIVHGPETRLFLFCVEAGFLTDRRDTACNKCGIGLFGVKDGRNGTGSAYVCSNYQCRYRESVTEHEAGFFLPRVTLSKQMMIVYNMVYHKIQSQAGNTGRGCLYGPKVHGHSDVQHQECGGLGDAAGNDSAPDWRRR